MMNTAIKIILPLLFSGINLSSSFGQEAKRVVGLRDLKYHVNDSVTIFATVKSITQNNISKKSTLTLYNKGKSGISVLVIVDDKLSAEMKGFNKSDIENKFIRVDGVLRKEKNKYSIYVVNKSQMANISNFEPPGDY